MKRPLQNLIIDLGAALSLLGMILTGYILRFPLPPGTNKSLQLWGLTRHEWGAVHFWISTGLLLLLAVHIALHWQWLVGMFQKHFLARAPLAGDQRRFALWVGFVLAVLAGAFALAAQLSVTEIAPR